MTKDSWHQAWTDVADHVLCVPAVDGWRIAAMIDFGDARIGAPECEWMPLRRERGQPEPIGSMEAFQELICPELIFQ